jgi:hypothetical protein
MICPHCGYRNDNDAVYCENCGKPLKKQPSSGLSGTTKILIVFIVILVAALGIIGGSLLKNSQTTPTQNNTTQISQANGIPVSETPNLAAEIAKTNGVLSSITYGPVTLDQNQCIYILARAIVLINQGQGGNIPLKSFGSAPNPYGNINSGTIAKSQYVDIATRMYTWMDSNGQTPNFIGISTPGQADLSPTTALNLFSKVLSQYKNTGQLPASVNL